MNTPNGVVLKLSGIAKSFGSVKALRNINLDIRKGEVHALLGENGSGKSTTMKIISGELVPDQGDYELAGKRVDDQFDVSASKENGISMVHQELASFNAMSVAENLFPDLSPYCNRLGFLDRKALRKASNDLLKVFELGVSPDTSMEDLTVGQQQLVEILRATATSDRLVILDEPTSSLNAHETDILLKLIAKLSAKGVAVLFVSHRIPEVLQVCDRITVLKDGASVETLTNKGLQESDLIERMVGRELEGLYSRKAYHDHSAAPVAFEARNLSGAGFSKVGLKLRKGEVMGVFGLEGSGVWSLSKSLYGLDDIGQGEILVSGQAIKKPCPISLIDKGVGYLSDNRKESGLFLKRSFVTNVSAPLLRKLSRWGVAMDSVAQEIATIFQNKFRIKIPNIDASPDSLSGGNQQKIMLATVLSTAPSVLIVNEPTRGVDVGAKLEMHVELEHIVSEGCSLLVFSSEIPELITLCDQVVVLRGGLVAGSLLGNAITEESVLELAAGSSVQQTAGVSACA